MRRLRAHATAADVVHLQWLSVPDLDRFLLPRRPRVFTVHYPLPASERARRRQRGLLSRMDALIAHSEHGADELRALVGDPTRVHRIPHGAFNHLAHQPDERPLPARAGRGRGAGDPLLRPRPPLQGRRRAARGVPASSTVPSSGWSGCRAWTSPRCGALAERCRARVRFVDRFITDPEIPAYFRRADLVALPYRRIEQSGVLYTALAFGKPIVASAIGGFTEVGERDRALRLVPPGDPAALAEALAELLADPDARAALARPPPPPRPGPYSWEDIARRTLDVYRPLIAG